MEGQYRRLAGSLQDLQTRLDTAVTNQTEVRLSINNIQHTVSLLDSRLQVVLLLVFQYFPLSLTVSCPMSFLNVTLALSGKVSRTLMINFYFSGF